MKKKCIILLLSYRKIPKICLGLTFFKEPFWGAYFWGGWYSEGLIYGGKFGFQNRSCSFIVERNLPFLLCFTLYLRACIWRGLFLEFYGSFYHLFCISHDELIIFYDLPWYYFCHWHRSSQDWFSQLLLSFTGTLHMSSSVILLNHHTDTAEANGSLS